MKNYLYGVLFVITKCTDDQSKGHPTYSLKKSQSDNPDCGPLSRDFKHVDYEYQHKKYLKKESNEHSFPSLIIF